MLKIDPRWGEDAQSLLKRSLEASDRHVRKRLLALHFIASGESGLRVASKLGVHRAAVALWVQKFNQSGLEGLSSRWRGKLHRILSEQELAQLKEAVRHHPRQVGLKSGQWTKRTVAAYIQKRFGKTIHPDTARKYLHLLGFGYRKPDKNLLKADPQEQKEFAQSLEALEQTRTPRGVTVYVDEGSIHQDVLPRKGWFLREEPAQVDSTSPGKKKSSSMRP